MTIHRYYQVSESVVAALALGLLGLSGACPGWLAFLGFGLLPHLPWGDKARDLTRRVRPLFLVSCIGFGSVAYFRTDDILLLFASTFVGILPWIQGRKDEVSSHWLFLLIAFLSALVALIAGNGVVEYTLFFAFSAATVFTLNAGHLYFHLGHLEAATRTMPHRYFLPFIVSVGGGMSVGVFLFVFFPRSLQWVNPFGLRNVEAMTGYTGAMALEGSGPTENTRLALLVESPEPEWLERVGPSLYFRGNTLSVFDGVRWSNTTEEPLAFSDPKAIEFTQSTLLPLRELRIFREPHLAQAIIYPGILRQIDAPLALLGDLERDSHGNLMRGNTGWLRYTYRVLIAPLDPAPLLSVTPVASWQTQGLSSYLHIPRSIAQAPYFQNWLNELGVSPGEVPLGKALYRLQTHFRRHFKATFGAAFPGASQLEAFLSKQKEAHCEYFATTAALTLRAWGVPSRIVLGYFGGTYNAVAKVLEVRERNAHAWVEAWSPGAGWVTFDPTPLTVRDRPAPWYQAAQDYATAVKFWFQTYVIDYNSETQKQLFRDLTGGGGRFSWKNGLGPMALAALLIAVLWGLQRLGIYLRSRQRKKHTREIPSYYRVFERKLRSIGIRRRESETYAKFHARLKGLPLVDEIETALERDLYSPNPSSPETTGRLEQKVLRFRPKAMAPSLLPKGERNR